ncbi:helix-turn-helix domain-containing protein [Streptomyces sp. NPDC059255]|uniref:helix-turn-helix domain-containing protein n=1 Tax=Streptomyces sp. NPDC059255 TaxID=3346793 RepID=UPI00368364BB
MDVFGDLIRGVRAHGSLFGSPTLSPPWSLGRRMAPAADLLVGQTSSTVAHIARTVGYTDPFAFSAAFKRIRGTNPSEFRRTAEVGVRAP